MPSKLLNLVWEAYKAISFFINTCWFCMIIGRDSSTCLHHRQISGNPVLSAFAFCPSFLWPAFFILQRTRINHLSKFIRGHNSPTASAITTEWAGLETSPFLSLTHIPESWQPKQHEVGLTNKETTLLVQWWLQNKVVTLEISPGDYRQLNLNKGTKAHWRNYSFIDKWLENWSSYGPNLNS